MIIQWTAKDGQQAKEALEQAGLSATHKDVTVLLEKVTQAFKQQLTEELEYFIADITDEQERQTV